MGFHFGKWTAAELRFHRMRWRAGGPWLNRYIVHDAPHRYGVSFKTAKGWQFVGLILLRNQRVVTEQESD